MTELKYDPRNYRIHTDKNKRLIKKSLEDCGTGRSILLDRNDVIIAGNGVYEQALELGLKVRVVESDGNELIAIRRTDLSTEDEKRKLLALADNHTSDTSMMSLVIGSWSFHLMIYQQMWIVFLREQIRWRIRERRWFALIAERK